MERPKFLPKIPSDSLMNMVGANSVVEEVQEGKVHDLAPNAKAASIRFRERQQRFHQGNSFPNDSERAAFLESLIY